MGHEGAARAEARREHSCYWGCIEHPEPSAASSGDEKKKGAAERGGAAVAGAMVAAGAGLRLDRAVTTLLLLLGCGWHTPAVTPALAQPLLKCELGSKSRAKSKPLPSTLMALSLDGHELGTQLAQAHVLLNIAASNKFVLVEPQQVLLTSSEKAAVPTNEAVSGGKGADLAALPLLPGRNNT